VQSLSSQTFRPNAPSAGRSFIAEDPIRRCSGKQYCGHVKPIHNRFIKSDSKIEIRLGVDRGDSETIEKIPLRLDLWRIKKVKKKTLWADRKALSPVIASIILCSAVLLIGLSAWSYTYSVSAFLQTSYFEDVKKQIDAISERFAVEHIAYDNSSSILYVWVYNYGEVNIEVDVYVMAGDEETEGKNFSETATPIPYGEVLEMTVPLQGENLTVGDELVVEVVSRRGNFVYKTYVVPVQQV